MKIRTIERITEIEADARELRESNTLAENLASLIARCFKGTEPLDESEADEVEEEEE